MNLNKALSAGVEAAQAAGKLLRQNLRASKKVNAATRHDIKLELDVRCQKLIERKLHAVFPEIAVLGEEGSSGAEDAEFRWVIDPIDGTVNFAHTIPHAAVSIALQVRRPRPKPGSGKVPFAPRDALRVPGSSFQATGCVAHDTVAGVVYDPFTDEMWTAIRGSTAQLNAKLIHVSRVRTLSQSIASIGFSKDRTSLERTLPYFTWLSGRVMKIRMMGSAALALTYVATGRFDVYIERGISLWDIAAGGLILECAGGKFWHQPIEGPHRYRMLATNGLLHSKLPPPK